jgi:hypothetical protein
VNLCWESFSLLSPSLSSLSISSPSSLSSFSPPSPLPLSLSPAFPQLSSILSFYNFITWEEPFVVFCWEFLPLHPLSLSSLSPSFLLTGFTIEHEPFVDLCWGFSPLTLLSTSPSSLPLSLPLLSTSPLPSPSLLLSPASFLLTDFYKKGIEVSLIGHIGALVTLPLSIPSPSPLSSLPLLPSLSSLSSLPLLSLSPLPLSSLLIFYI